MTRQCMTNGNFLSSWETQSVALRQLRHHTRNALQRVLMEIHEHVADRRTPRDRYLLQQLVDRIQLSVEISDTLFGITREPGLFLDRLRTLCHGIVSLFADPAQHLMVDIAMEGVCPSGLENAALRAVHEFVGNAVKHGMRMRLLGRVSVSLSCSADELELVVADDGWGLAPEAHKGQGIGIARDLADEFGGTVSLERRSGSTVATIVLREVR
jgi:two-component sensor histidine kinase